MNASTSSVLAPLATLALACSLTAQTPISGAQSGGLAPGVYNVVGNLTVAAGQTWTLSAGVILKFTSGYQVTVDGTMIANGTAISPVIFTDDADDTAGGDTNGNGPSVGAPGSWRGIIFNATASTSSLNYMDVRYGGSSFVPNITLNTCNLTMTNCISRDNFSHGMQCNSNSLPTVSNCAFIGNGNTAVDGVSFAGVPLFTNNTAAGNSKNYLHVTTAAVNSNLTISAGSQINNALMLSASIVIDPAATLTLQPNVIIKFTSGYQITANGPLMINGTSGNPVIITDDGDDSAGGDTNNNGPSSGASGSWRGITFASTASSSVLNYADLRYGGSSFVPHVVLNSCDLTMTNCISRDNFSHGMQLSSNSYPTITNCSFVNNGGTAVDGVQLAALPNITSNTASGNNKNYLHITGASLNANLTLSTPSIINQALMLSTSIVVPVGVTLTLEEDVIIKFTSGYQITVDGTLLINGSAGHPVIVTVGADDSAGGDTNNNGASVGAPGSWRGMVFGSGAGNSELNYADLRYGGSSFVPHVVLNSCDLTMNNCISRDNFSHGMQCSTNSFPTVNNCAFEDNGGNAIVGVRLDAVPGFLNNTAAGNGNDNMHISNAAIDSQVQIGTQSVLNGALITSASITVAANGELTVEQGVNFKFTSGYQVVVDGQLHCNGTGFEPVAFTTNTDDSIGGDTNNNGPSAGAPGSWRGILINASANTSSLENVIIRYTGSSFVPGLQCANANTSLRSVRVDDSFSNGFVISACAGNPVNLVAWECGGHGIHLTGGAFDLVHATCASNNQGIRSEAAYTGNVVNSISYGNGTNFFNLTAANVFNSNGDFAGTNGNINSDPQFVAQATGDLHLTTGSPSLGSADIWPAFLTLKDHDENSRILDHALIGLPLPDMGAYELAAWDMAFGGTTQIGTTINYQVTGPAGLSFYLFGDLVGVTPVIPYGFGLAGSGLTVLNPVPLPVGAVFPIAIPVDPSIVGVAAGIQTVTFPLSGITVGNFTRLHRALVRP